MGGTNRAKKIKSSLDVKIPDPKNPIDMVVVDDGLLARKGQRKKRKLVIE